MSGVECVAPTLLEGHAERALGATPHRHASSQGVNVTEYRFENHRVNSELPEGRFDLELPHDVEVKNVELEGRPSMR